MGMTLIFIGFVIILVGVVLNVLSKYGLRTLPGDIFIQKENFTFYFPIATSLIISIILTILLNLLR